MIRSLFLAPVLMFAGGVAFAAPPSSDYSVTSFGAVGDGVTKDTAAIQRAVDAAAAAGGGRVVVPAGTFLSGTVYLKSRVELHLAAGARLLGSPDVRDYCAADAYPQNTASPRRESDLDGENTTGGHLLVAVEQTDVALTGPGTVDGNGLTFATYPDGRERPHQRDYEARPSQMIHFCECENVRITDVNLVNPPFWTCLLHGCDHVFVRGVRVDVPRKPHILNGDGFSIDTCRFVTMSDSQISSYDDGITIRGDGRRLRRPGRECAHVTVANCTITSRTNGIRIGVGTNAIHDVVFSNVSVYDSPTAVNFCPAWAGKGGTPIRDVRLSNFTVDCGSFLRMHRFGAKTPLTDVTIDGVTGQCSNTSRILTVPELPFERIRLRNFNVREKRPGESVFINVKDFELTGSVRGQSLTAEGQRELEQIVREGRWHQW